MIPTKKAKGKWGKMNGQQMTEHMSDAFRWANGRSPQKPALTPQVTQKYYEFMMTEKPFRENTPNQLISDESPPLKHHRAALPELKYTMEFLSHSSIIETARQVYYQSR